MSSMARDIRRQFYYQGSKLQQNWPKINEEHLFHYFFSIRRKGDVFITMLFECLNCLNDNITK